jgi:isoamylase
MPAALAQQTTRVIDGGAPFPLGATPSSDGVNFAVYSRNATAAYLLLFDAADGEPTDVIELTSRDKFVWHAFVRGLRPGQL